MTVTDVEEAKAAVERGADALAVQSSAAGGHRGTFDQLREPGAEPLGELVRAIAAATALPLIAAGGLGDRDAVRTALEAGAAAVSVGTALLLADEAGTNASHRRALAEPGAVTTTMRAYTGRVARGIRTTFSERYDAAAPAGYPAIHHLTSPMRQHAAAEGDPQHLHLWAGTAFAQARRGSVAEILQTLAP